MSKKKEQTEEEKDDLIQQLHNRINELSQKCVRAHRLIDSEAIPDNRINAIRASVVTEAYKRCDEGFKELFYDTIWYNVGVCAIVSTKRQPHLGNQRSVKIHCVFSISGDGFIRLM